VTLQAEARSSGGEAMGTSPTANGGTVLLLLASRDARSAAQLTAASGLSPAETVRQLHRLTDQGFLIASSPDAADVRVYRLNPKGVRTEALGWQVRALLAG
jgi:DNA-binding IclR family transcriptional regulator